MLPASPVPSQTQPAPRTMPHPAAQVPEAGPAPHAPGTRGADRFSAALDDERGASAAGPVSVAGAGAGAAEPGLTAKGTPNSTVATLRGARTIRSGDTPDPAEIGSAQALSGVPVAAGAPATAPTDPGSESPEVTAAAAAALAHAQELARPAPWSGTPESADGPGTAILARAPAEPAMAGARSVAPDAPVATAEMPAKPDPGPVAATGRRADGLAEGRTDGRTGGRTGEATDAPRPSGAPSGPPQATAHPRAAAEVAAAQFAASPAYGADRSRAHPAPVGPDRGAAPASAAPDAGPGSNPDSNPGTIPGTIPDTSPAAPPRAAPASAESAPAPVAPAAPAATGAEVAPPRDGPGRLEPPAQGQTVPDPAGTALRPETTRQIAAIGVARMPEGAEIRLAPDELGAVRLQLVVEGDVLRVAISAERPETLDLMRRHAPDLAAEFRALGYGGAAFSFDRTADQRDPGGSRSATAEGLAEDRPPDAPAPAATRRAGVPMGTTLDIRI